MYNSDPQNQFYPQSYEVKDRQKTDFYPRKSVMIPSISLLLALNIANIVVQILMLIKYIGLKDELQKAFKPYSGSNNIYNARYNSLLTEANEIISGVIAFIVLTAAFIVILCLILLFCKIFVLFCVLISFFY